MKPSMQSLFLAIALLLSNATAQAYAATVYFSADGGANGSGAVETQVGLDKLGAVALPRGKFRINGDSAEVTVIPEWQFDKRKALTGVVLDSRMAPQGQRPVISGVVFFDSGEWIGYFDNPKAIETVNTADKSVSGRIADVVDGKISIYTPAGQTETIPLASVVSVHSPRVFDFSITTTAMQPGTDGEPPYAQAKSVLLASTETPFHLAMLRSMAKRDSFDGDVPTSKLVALGAFLSAVELAQLVPYIAVPAAGAKLQHQMFRRQLFSNTNGTGLVVP